MTNKSDQKKQKITPASHGDELDVLEAVYRLEKERGISILTKDQKSLLVESKRAGETKNKSKENKNTSLRGFVVDEEKVNTINSFVNGVRLRLIQKFETKFSGEKWEELNDVEKNEAVDLLFSMVYGFSPKHFKLLLLGKRSNE